MTALTQQAVAGPSGVSPLHFEAHNATRERESPWHALQADENSYNGVTLSGLCSEALYAVRVEALAASGASALSALQFFTTAEPEPQPGPDASIVSITAARVKLQWPAAQPSGHSDAASAPVEHEVQMANVGQDGASPRACTHMAWTHAYRGAQAACTVSALQPGCCYAFRVRTHSGKHATLWGTEANCQTLVAPPAAPSALVCLQRTQRSLHVSWEAVEDQPGHAPVTAYRCATGASPSD